MSSFTSKLQFESTDDFMGRRRIVRLRPPALEYCIGSKGSSLVLKVEPGYLTDLGSVPWPLFGVVTPDGPWAAAFVVHDRLYREGLVSRLIADLILLEGLKVLGCPAWQRWAIFLAVRVGGRRAYKEIVELVENVKEVVQDVTGTGSPSQQGHVNGSRPDSSSGRQVSG